MKYSPKTDWYSNDASFFPTIKPLRTKQPGSYDENFWLHPLNMAKFQTQLATPLWRVANQQSRRSTLVSLSVTAPFALCRSFWVLRRACHFIRFNHDQEQVKPIVDKQETLNFAPLN